MTGEGCVTGLVIYSLAIILYGIPEWRYFLMKPDFGYAPKNLDLLSPTLRVGLVRAHTSLAKLLKQSMHISPERDVLQHLIFNNVQPLVVRLGTNLARNKKQLTIVTYALAMAIPPVLLQNNVFLL